MKNSERYSKEYLNAMMRKWYAKNKARVAAYHVRYYAKNKEKVRRRNAEWQKNNVEKARKYSAEYLREYRKRDPERFRGYEARRKNRKERSTAHYKANKAKIIDMVNRRRDKTIRIETPECTAKIAILHNERFCHWCCKPLTDKNRTIDHVTPLFRGGKHIADNLVTACRSCNSSKCHKLVHEWTWKLWEKAA